VRAASIIRAMSEPSATSNPFALGSVIALMMEAARV
jgi:hypothetical protein